MIHLDRPWKQNLRVPMALRWRNGLAKARENFLLRRANSTGREVMLRYRFLNGSRVIFSASISAAAMVRIVPVSVA